ncbi:MAG: ABC transporter ATP-binding protein [Acidobacteriota bacterium]
MASEAAVEVRGLRKTFYDEGRGEVKAVDSIDFTCERGQVFGLLGANGAGKTTTLRMLSTVLKPTGGEARIEGLSVAERPAEVRRRLGFYSASTALYPRLTARETLEFFARVNRYPASEVRARVDEIIERFGMGPFQNARVDKLSSGMKQRVSIGRTVVHDPPVVIFDEPTVGLDVLNALALIDAIRDLRDAGKTVIFSTHIMSEAEKLCDRLAIMHGGRILVAGDLETLRGQTGQHYLEDIFVNYVSDADEETRLALERRDARELEGIGGRPGEPAP